MEWLFCLFLPITIQLEIIRKNNIFLFCNIYWNGHYPWLVWAYACLGIWFWCEDFLMEQCTYGELNIEIAV